VAEPSLDDFEAVRGIRTGAALEVEGALVPSPGSGQRFELKASRVAIVGAVGDDYPLQKKRHSFEFLREIAHLRPRTNTIGAVLRVRNAAGDLFRVTTLDPGRTPGGANGEVDYAQDFFGRQAFLTVSGQLEAEIAALAMTDVYTFGPTFRAENSNTSRHLAEFWMVEPEMAFCDLEGDMDVAEAFLKSIFHHVLESCPDDMEFFAKRIDGDAIDRLRHVVDTPFERITYTEAVQILGSCGRDFEYPVKWGADLQSEHERFLAEEHIDLQSEHERFLAEEHIRRPVIVTDYPASIKAFYMYQNDDEETVRAMDVLVPKVGEIIGGSQREHRLDVLSRRLAEAGLDESNYWWYLDLRRHGTAPHAGFGLGFERVVQFMTGMANIRDVVPFPRVPGYAEF
jgi:asparaginyl-tRNA synthetase